MQSDLQTLHLSDSQTHCADVSGQASTVDTLSVLVQIANSAREHNRPGQDSTALHPSVEAETENPYKCPAAPAFAPETGVWASYIQRKDIYINLLLHGCKTAIMFAGKAAKYCIPEQGLPSHALIPYPRSWRRGSLPRGEDCDWQIGNGWPAKQLTNTLPFFFHMHRRIVTSRHLLFQ